MELEFAQLSAGPLLLIAVAAVATLLVLILAFKLHALIALVIVSIGTAFATRIPPSEIMDVILGGFGETLGEIALLIAFGVMFARLLETSGGSLALSNFLIDKLGEKRAPLALGLASLLFGFPIFFDAAFMVMLPLYLAVARRLGGSMLMYVLPPAAALSTMHVFMPPHPGVVTAGVLLGADVGLVMLLGLVVAIPTWFLSGYLYGSWIGKRIVLPIPEALMGGPQADPTPATDDDGSSDDGSSDEGSNDEGSGGTTPGGGGGTKVATAPRRRLAAQTPPSVRTMFTLLFLPLILIFLNTLTTTLAKTGTIDPDAAWVPILQLIGSIPVALMITVLAAMWALGTRRGQTKQIIEDMLDNALKPIAPVLLVTGAGGMFSAVLIVSGIGDALADTLKSTGLPLVAAIFFITAIMRVALGGTTIAITTAAGLLGASIVDSGLSPVQTAAAVLVMAGGSAVLPHVNDASFWLVGRLLGMNVIETLKTWTVLKTLLGTIGALFASGIFYLA
ncbi:GntP family permease [Rhodococcoides fascians]|uniref:GntP family permease n=1 Tax=Rhodococcoides fascians TaxID=1828 RepID=UPI000561972E|nr:MULTISPECIES: SLC13 family permease [Rhodococcus]OZF01280.1 permease [Rhodococcus sp. 15-1189-1-1a]OZF15451.1 permease [Rhodococcus sp. 14-2686-1-2]